jgi:tetratricopeptide (TPR) repeat protein
MTRARVALALLAAVAMTSLAPRDAAAQLAGARPLPTSRPTGGAVDHFKEAVDLFGRGEIVAACRKFEQSYAEDAAPGTLYNLAQCHEREGRIADAYREYDALASLAESAKLADKAASVRARASALLPRLGRVDLVHRSDAVSGISGLTIDGTPFAVDVSKKPLYLAPGAHVIGIQHADGVTVTRRIDAIAAGESRRVEMEDPAPAQPKASAPRVVRQEVVVNRKRRTAAYVVGASGAVLAAGGVALGVLTLVERNRFQTLCGVSGKDCQPGDVQKAYDDRYAARTAATLSTVGFAAGGVALAASAYLFVTSREERSARTALEIAPSSDGHGVGMQLGGRF